MTDRREATPPAKPSRHGESFLPDDPRSSLTAPTALIVSAYLKNNRLQIADLPAIFSTVHAALVGTAGPAPVEPQEPGANLRRLVTSGAIVCAECGKRFKSIKRHLSTSHGLTPSAYLAKWGLKRGHPMVAPDYAAARSALAKSIGLGRKSAQQPGKAPAKASKVRASVSKPAAEKTSRKARAARKPKTAPAA